MSKRKTKEMQISKTCAFENFYEILKFFMQTQQRVRLADDAICEKECFCKYKNNSNKKGNRNNVNFNYAP